MHSALLHKGLSSIPGEDSVARSHVQLLTFFCFWTFQIVPESAQDKMSCSVVTLQRNLFSVVFAYWTVKFILYNMVWKWRSLDSLLCRGGGLVSISLGQLSSLPLFWHRPHAPHLALSQSTKHRAILCIGPDCMDSSVLYIPGFVSLDTTMPVFMQLLLLQL